MEIFSIKTLTVSVAIILTALVLTTVVFMIPFFKGEVAQIMTNSAEGYVSLKVEALDSYDGRNITGSQLREILCEMMMLGQSLLVFSGKNLDKVETFGTQLEGIDSTTTLSGLKADNFVNNGGFYSLNIDLTKPSNTDSTHIHSLIRNDSLFYINAIYDDGGATIGLVAEQKNS